MIAGSISREVINYLNMRNHLQTLQISIIIKNMHKCKDHKINNNAGSFVCLYKEDRRYTGDKEGLLSIFMTRCSRRLNDTLDLFSAILEQ